MRIPIPVNFNEVSFARLPAAHPLLFTLDELVKIWRDREPLPGYTAGSNDTAEIRALNFAWLAAWKQATAELEQVIDAYRTSEK